MKTRIFTLGMVLFLSVNTFSQGNGMKELEKVKDYVKKKVYQQNDIKNFQSTVKWRWDTIIFYDTLNNVYGRLIRSFNQNGLQSDIVEQRFNNSAWDELRKTEFYYYPNNLIFEIYNLYWNNIEWVYSDKVEHVYDSLNRLLVQTNYTFDGVVFNYTSKVSYTYLSNSKITLYEYWDSNIMDWVGSSRITETYDNNNLIEQINEFYDEVENQWKYSGKLSITYNNNQPQQAYYYSWNDSLNDWENIYFYDVYYSPANDTIILLLKINQDGNWVNNIKEIYTYIQNFNNSYTLFYWDNSISDWIPIKRELNSEINGQYETIEQTWDNSLSNWLNFGRTSYEVNGYGNTVWGMFELWENNNWKPYQHVTSYPSHYYSTIPIYENSELYDNINTNWDYYKFQAHFIQQTITYTENNFLKTFEIYPNPAHEFIFLTSNDNINHLSIYTLDGKLIYQSIPNSTELKVNIQDFENSMYIMKISVKDEIKYIKFIKQ